MGHLETYLIVTIIGVIIAFLLFILGMSLVFRRHKKLLEHTVYCKNKELVELHSEIVKLNSTIEMQQDSINTLGERLRYFETH